MRIKDFGTIPLVAALIGASIGTVVYARAPALYESSSTIRFSGNFADANSASSQAFRQNLARAVPAGEVQAATSVVLLASSDDSSVVRISHAARDAKAAQNVVKEIVVAALSGSGDAGTVVEPPALPTATQRAHGFVPVPVGAGLGLLLGAAFVVLRRVPRAAPTGSG